LSINHPHPQDYGKRANAELSPEASAELFTGNLEIKQKLPYQNLTE